MSKPKIEKPKFFLPGDKVKIKGGDEIYIIECWSDDHVKVDEEYCDEDEEESNDDDECIDSRDGKDYKNWDYSTTVSAWHDYKDITFVEAGWMREMLNK